ncbi:MAG: Crp/Fnr family transcriptional regulator [Candidatus Competibacterales bacterium]
MPLATFCTNLARRLHGTKRRTARWLQGLKSLESNIWKAPLSDNIWLFAGLSPAEYQVVSAHTAVKVYPRNSVLISEGERAEELFVLLSGRVKVMRCDAKGREFILNTQGPGEFFGELGLLDGLPRSATVVAMEDSRVLVITRKHFMKWVESDPELAFKLILALVRRVRELSDHLHGIVHQKVQERVWQVLSSAVEWRDDEGWVSQTLTHQDIANMVGSSREMVTRAMGKLQQQGVIAVGEREYKILEKKSGECS